MESLSSLEKAAEPSLLRTSPCYNNYSDQLTQQSRVNCDNDGTETYPMDNERLALTLMWTSMICSLLGFTVPWPVLLVSRAAAAATAGILAVIGTIAFLISNAFMPAEYNIRVDLLIIPPLLLAAWVSFIGLTIWASRH